MITFLENLNPLRSFTIPMKNESFEQIKGKLDSLPKKPGVYLLKDSSGTILYIGKAKILRSRVRSYFQNSMPQHIKTHLLTKKIKDIETIITDTEKEALILETNLVKLYRPRYNVNLKDDKSYPYIKITNEDFPQVYITRKKMNDGSTYFGPYTEVKVMRSLLWTMRKIFQIRSCKFKLTPDTIQKRKVKLCLDYHIKRCGGPCEELVSKEDYNEMVDQVREFFRGHTKNLVALLTEKMNESAEDQLYETAALFRDRLREIDNFHSKQKVVDIKPVDRDIVAVAVEENVACGVVFMEREGKILGRRHHALDGVGNKSHAEILKSFMMQFYLNIDYIPPEIFVSHDVEDRGFITDWMSGERGSNVNIIIPQKGDKAKLTGMCIKNAELLVQELILQQRQKKDFLAYSVKTLQENLKLSHPPQIIEAFDISNIQGKDAVASMVSFSNGVPQKKEYRIFKIRHKDTPDDFKMITEAVKRRYSRQITENGQLPDLILIDGGKGQLSSAVEVLRNLDLMYIPIVGLAKRLDEVFIPGVSEAQNIPRTSAGLRLLQRVRDEAHRFAITHHRKQRKKRTITSELDKIPGIGVERRKALLQYFGSISKLREAEPETIVNVKSINFDLAQIIHNHLNAQ